MRSEWERRSFLDCRSRKITRITQFGLDTSLLLVDLPAAPGTATYQNFEPVLSQNAPRLPPPRNPALPFLGLPLALLPLARSLCSRSPSSPSYRRLPVRNRSSLARQSIDEEGVEY